MYATFYPECCIHLDYIIYIDRRGENFTPFAKIFKKFFDIYSEPAEILMESSLKKLICT